MEGTIMETFSVKFQSGNLDLNAIVTEYDHHQKFKVEMVTKVPEPLYDQKTGLSYSFSFVTIQGRYLEAVIWDMVCDHADVIVCN